LVLIDDFGLSAADAPLAPLAELAFCCAAEAAAAEAALSAASFVGRMTFCPYSALYVSVLWVLLKRGVSLAFEDGLVDLLHLVAQLWHELLLDDVGEGLALVAALADGDLIVVVVQLVVLRELDDLDAALAVGLVGVA